ncbi:N-acetylglucosaminyl-phosphatidylinositol biosynthetic protein-like isoform X1 [Varroa destructor]|uniref:phosphatidylinositol N-acetylglucosaminyltransferase n=1 Tax=Varroa destructor TaxID=109461 RepID=A0A7M7MC22_VARDE|nr:N-acetylglucosaminyl-phosphatidylinositol biosynthetic protein-like isoform X1 [Varroa destructor]
MRTLGPSKILNTVGDGDNSADDLRAGQDRKSRNLNPQNYGGGDCGVKNTATIESSTQYRICLVSDFFHPNTGGVETHIYQLAQCLLQRGHSVIVLTHTYADRIGIRYLTNGLKVIHIPLCVVYCESGLPTLFCPSRLIRNILVRERVQIVHSHGAFSSLALETLVHAACLGNIRSVFTDHSLFGFSDVSAVITNTLLKLCLHVADHVICVSEVGRMNTALRARVSPDRISVIPNAVEFAMFAPPSEPRQSEDTVIIVLCRLMYRKGIDLLAQVIPIICRRHHDVRFFVGGDGPKRILLEEVREHFKLQERVLLRGNLRHNEVRDFLVSGDIFLNTSLTEAFCMAIVEAASCGLQRHTTFNFQVVSTNVGGIPHVLPPELIWLCTPSVQSLVSGLEQAIHAKRSGTRKVSPNDTNRQVSELYQWSSVGVRTEQIYHNVMSRDKPCIAKAIQSLFCKATLFESLFFSYVLSLLYLMYKLFSWVYPLNEDDFPIIYAPKNRRKKSGHKNNHPQR